MYCEFIIYVEVKCMTKSAQKKIIEIYSYKILVNYMNWNNLTGFFFLETDMLILKFTIQKCKGLVIIFKRRTKNIYTT